MRALVGSTGFVGTSLLRQTTFDLAVHRPTAGLLDGQDLDLLVIAGAPAAKWLANAHPDEDIDNLRTLVANLSRVGVARHTVLVSTVDVYAEPRGVDEGDRPPAQHPEPYGQHRLWLERQVQDAFPRVTVLRLPALFGPGLRKNFLYDLQQGKNLELTDHRSVFQFYDMNDLWADIQRILSMDLPLVHLVTEPMSASRVAAACFGHQSAHERTDREPAAYDVRTRYTKALGGSDGYLMDECAVLSRIRRWRASA